MPTDAEILASLFDKFPVEEEEDIEKAELFFKLILKIHEESSALYTAPLINTPIHAFELVEHIKSGNSLDAALSVIDLIADQASLIQLASEALGAGAMTTGVGTSVAFVSGFTAAFLGALGMGVTVLQGVYNIPLRVHDGIYKRWFNATSTGLLTAKVFEDSHICNISDCYRRASISCGHFGYKGRDAILFANRNSERTWDENFRGKRIIALKHRAVYRGNWRLMWRNLARKADEKHRPDQVGSNGIVNEIIDSYPNLPERLGKISKE